MKGENVTHGFEELYRPPNYRSGATLSLLTRGMNIFSVTSNENHNFYELAAKEGNLQLDPNISCRYGINHNPLQFVTR